MAFLEDDFRDFIRLDANRAGFIQNFLNEAGLDCPVIPVDGKKHLYVSFPKSQYSPLFKIKTVIAHYDRVENTPGANDNSSSVYALLHFARRLCRRHGSHNIRIIFTDGEELSSEGVASQGAFGLAKLFKRLGITDEDVFVFDCMGRGTIPILTQSVLPKNAPKAFARNFCALEDKAEVILTSVCQKKWLSLPCNYSDNAGFIANGIPAVAFTMLPSDEADAYLLGGKKPLTWEKLHTMDDDFESLDARSFEITARILDGIADLRSVRS